MRHNLRRRRYRHLQDKVNAVLAAEGAQADRVTRGNPYIAGTGSDILDAVFADPENPLTGYLHSQGVDINDPVALRRAVQNPQFQEVAAHSAGGYGRLFRWLGGVIGGLFKPKAPPKPNPPRQDSKPDSQPNPRSTPPAPPKNTSHEAIKRAAIEAGLQLTDEQIRTVAGEVYEKGRNLEDALGDYTTPHPSQEPDDPDSNLPNIPITIESADGFDSYPEYRKFIFDKARKIFGDRGTKENPHVSVVNDETGWEIKIPMKGIKHAVNTAEFTEGLGAVLKIPELIQHAKKRSSEKDRRNERGVKQVHNFNVLTTINGATYHVNIVVKEKVNGTLFYDQKIMTEAKRLEMKEKERQQRENP